MVDLCGDVVGQIAIDTMVDILGQEMYCPHMVLDMGNLSNRGSKQSGDFVIEMSSARTVHCAVITE